MRSILGDFPAALASIEQALTLARATGQDQLLGKLREKRTCYEAGQPFRSK